MAVAFQSIAAIRSVVVTAELQQKLAKVCLAIAKEFGRKTQVFTANAQQVCEQVGSSAEATRDYLNSQSEDFVVQQVAAFNDLVQEHWNGTLPADLMRHLQAVETSSPSDRMVVKPGDYISWNSKIRSLEKAGGVCISFACIQGGHEASCQ